VRKVGKKRCRNLNNARKGRPGDGKWGKEKDEENVVNIFVKCQMNGPKKILLHKGKKFVDRGGEGAASGKKKKGRKGGTYSTSLDGRKKGNGLVPREKEEGLLRRKVMPKHQKTLGREEIVPCLPSAGKKRKKRGGMHVLFSIGKGRGGVIECLYLECGEMFLLGGRGGKDRKRNSK